MQAVPPVASEFATEMTLHNVWGQAVLMCGRLDDIQDYYLSMATGYRTLAMEAETKRKDIEDKLKRLKRAESMMEEMRHQLDTEEQDCSAREAEYDLMKRKPGLARLAGLGSDSSEVASRIPREKWSFNHPAPIRRNSATLNLNAPLDSASVPPPANSVSRSRDESSEEPDTETEAQNFKEIAMNKREKDENIEDDIRDEVGTVTDDLLSPRNGFINPNDI